MTAEEAEKTYYEAYRKASKSDGITPLIQADVRQKSWQAVVDAFQKEYDTELAKRYLAMNDVQGPHNVSDDRINALVERSECEG